MGHEVTTHVIHPERIWKSSQSNHIAIRFDNRFATAKRVIDALQVIRDSSCYDVIMMNRDMIPEVKIDFLEPLLSKRNRHLIFDFDDSIHIGNRSKKLAKILPYFAAITPGNKFLADFASQFHNNVQVFPTVIDTQKYQPCQRKKSDLIRIGWSGSSSSAQQNLPTIERVITELAKLEHFEFVIISNEDPKINWRGVRTHFIQWTPESEVEGLCQFDIGIMPLDDGDLERGKCGLKAIQYMGVATPAVVSPVGVNAEIVLHNETGYHAKTDAEWIDGLRDLIHSPTKRKNFGENARTRIEEYYSINSQLPKLLQLFEDVSK